MMSHKEKEIVSNRRAVYNYEILETYEAGIVLLGTEIKSLRDHGGSLSEAYVSIMGNELWLVGANIAHYRFGNINNHVEKRNRKLLMHRKEIIKLGKFIQQKGFTIIPLGFFLKNGMVKVKIGSAKGKKLHDKRQTVIEREKKREMALRLKNHRL
ncbi:MAG: SsrA-binding protein SmpB [Victivallaceae bacterium]